MGHPDFPALVEVTRRVDAHTAADISDVAEATGLTGADVQVAGLALERRGLVRFLGARGHPVLTLTGVDGQAYLFAGLHPDGETAIDRLADAIRQAIGQTDDPEEKRGLRRFKDSLIDLPVVPCPGATSRRGWGAARRCPA